MLNSDDRTDGHRPSERSVLSLVIKQILKGMPNHGIVLDKYCFSSSFCFLICSFTFFLVTRKPKSPGTFIVPLPKYSTLRHVRRTCPIKILLSLLLPQQKFIRWMMGRASSSLEEGKKNSDCSTTFCKDMTAISRYALSRTMDIP